MATPFPVSNVPKAPIPNMAFLRDSSAVPSLIMVILYGF